MTKHRSKDEWIAEILEAAREEIDATGYTDFSMEAIVRRTGLSKGGIYRFFNNKSEVALEIFVEGYRSVLQFDVDECVKWNVPLAETIFRLLARYSMPEEGVRRIDRIWVRLLPEVLSDERFASTRAQLLDEIGQKLVAVSVAVVERDELQLPDDFEQRFSDAISMGVGLLEGFAVQSALGGSIRHQGDLVKKFVAGLVEDLIA